MENKKVYCPHCGSDNLQTVVKTNVQTYGKNYSVFQGVCGAFMLGPLGVLCGLCGQGKHTTTTNTSMFSCNDCGHEFKKREDLVRGVEIAEKSKKFVVPFMGIFIAIMFLFPALIVDNGDFFVLMLFAALSAFGISAPIGYLMQKKSLEKWQELLNAYDRKQAIMEKKRRNEEKPNERED